MSLLLVIPLVIFLLVTMAKAYQFRHVVRGTSLQPGYWWGLFALLFGLLLILANPWLSTDAEGGGGGGGLRDRLHFLAAVLLVCPAIAVLGARRPGAAVWIWFVVVPLIAVLCLPALHPRQGKFTDPLSLAPPALIGLGLALVMGFGNYVGTRFTFPALLSGLAVAFLVTPSTDLGRQFDLAADAALAGGILLVHVAVLLGVRSWRTRQRPDDPLLAGWLDMRDLFGIVWSRRWMDRINAIAAQEHWPLRLRERNLEWLDANLTRDQQAATRETLEKHLRWMLKRFADDAWIDTLFRIP